MQSQQLQQRLASCSQASCSHAAAPGVARSRRSHRRQVPHSIISVALNPRHRQICGATPYDDDSTQEIAFDPRNDTVFDNMSFASNSTPNFEDPRWIDKVEDWHDFWYNTEEDDPDMEDLPTAQRSEASLERAQLLVSQLSDLRTRADVEKMVTGEIRPFPFWEDTFKTEHEMLNEQVKMYAPDPNPHYNEIDLRALAEKRAARAALDAEWEHRKSLLAKPFSYTLSHRLGNDARLESAAFDWVREEWTHEQIMDMIVGGGKFVHPDKVQARALNPLLPVDFHNDVRVHVVPETEEFIEMIGHMATPDEIAQLEGMHELQLSGEDFADPSLVFEATDGSQYMEVPPNPWAELQKVEDMQDLHSFEALVDKVASRQRKRELAAFGDEGEDEDWGEYDEEDDDDADDEIMGTGFTAFMERDEDDEPGLLMYEDELDGDISESAFVERDEAEREGGEGDDEEGEGA